jgi:tetratricopeptide (TPR) repeat protein
MIDQPQASKLAKNAFDSWQAGQLDKAACLYEEALALADPMHWGLSAYYGEFSCVLNGMGKHDEATTQLEKALAAELAQGNTEGASGVTIARYFLANQLIERGDVAVALDVLEPSVRAAPTDWVTRMAEAQALYSLNRISEAKYAAQCAIDNAPSREKKAELIEYLGAIVGDARD